jgi:hypothetical protein
VDFRELLKPGMSVEESMARSEKLLESEAYSTGLKIRCSTN